MKLPELGGSKYERMKNSYHPGCVPVQMSLITPL